MTEGPGGRPVARARWFVSVLALAAEGAGCRARPGEALPLEVSRRATAAPAAAGTPPRPARCLTVEQWSARADEAERLGLHDVASGHRGRAYGQEPGSATLFAWSDGLVRSGELRRARAVLSAAYGGHAATEFAIAKRLEGIPAPREGPIGPSSPSERLVAARAARPAEAAALMRQIAEEETAPDRLADAGAALWALGERDAARRAWTRARIRVDELGGRVTMALPVRAGRGATPRLTALHRGRFIVVAGGAATTLWSLPERRPIARLGSSEGLVALSPEGGRAALQARDAWEIRELASRTAEVRAPGRLARAQFVGGGALLALGWREEPWFVALPGGQPRPLAAPLAGVERRMSVDGAWLAGRDTDGTLQVWRARPGGEVRMFAAPTGAFVFADDGSFLAWVERARPAARQLSVLRLEAGAIDRGEVFSGAGGTLELSPDGAELWIVDVPPGRTVRRWSTRGGPRVLEAFEVAGARDGVEFVDTGVVVLLVGRERIEVRRRDRSLARLGTIRPLHEGGWVLFTEAGALDGSDDAPDGVVAQVEGPRGALTLAGRVFWDAVHVPGALERVLAGEEVAPPVLPVASPAEPGCAPGWTPKHEPPSW